MLRLVVVARERPGAALAVAWLLGVAAVAALEPRTDTLSAALASSPDRLVGGDVWTLATSALVIDGPAPMQLLMMSVLTAWAIVRLGGRRFWLVAVAGHLGATLAAYVGIGVLWLVARGSVDRLSAEPDYGISAILAAMVAAATVVGWRQGGRIRRPAAAALGACVLAALVAELPVDGELADVEHLLAFMAGLATAALVVPRAAPAVQARFSAPA